MDIVVLGRKKKSCAVVGFHTGTQTLMSEAALGGSVSGKRSPAHPQAVRPEVRFDARCPVSLVSGPARSVSAY